MVCRKSGGGILGKILNGLFFVALIAPAQTGPATPIGKTVTIGLVLSAGGALGLAHIGVLKVLEREGIPIDCIAVNSMGSIVGGLYAAGYTATQIESIAVSLDWASLLTPGLTEGVYNLLEHRRNQRYLLSLEQHNFVPAVPRGLISLQAVEFLMIQLLADAEYDAAYDFDRLPIPIRVIAVDLNSGRKVVLKSGSLEKAIRGSIAIPGVFPPVLTADNKLVDGGVLQYLPVDPIREFAPDVIIAVLTAKRSAPIGTSLIDVLSRTSSMIGMEDIENQKRLADVVIEPDLAGFNATDYTRVRELIAVGETAATAVLPQIRALIADRATEGGRQPLPRRRRPTVRRVSFEGLCLLDARDASRKNRTRADTLLDFRVLLGDLKRLYYAGFFQSVGYRLDPTGKDTVDVIFETKEKEFGFYLFGLRYDNYDNVTLGLEFGQERITRSGFGIRGIINLGQPNEYRLRFTHGNPFVLPFSSHADLYWSSIDRSYYADRAWQADYNTDVRGGAIGLANHLGGKAFASADFQIHQAFYRFPTGGLFDTLPGCDWTVGPALSVEIDNQDDPFLPTRGLRFEMRAIYGLPLIRDARNFTKIELTFNRFVPINPWAALYYCVDLGKSWGRLPWNEYFYTGGDNFIGYKPETFTSRNKESAGIGLAFQPTRWWSQKEAAWTLKMEVDLGSFRSWDRLFGDSDDPLGHEFHVGAGAILVVKTPFGPLQFKIGWANLLPRGYREPGFLPTAGFVSLGKDFRYTK
jgi:predicted acylesterase/phospholipase RssA